MGYTPSPTQPPTTQEPTKGPTLDGCDFDIDNYLAQCYCSGEESEAAQPLYRHNPVDNVPYQDENYQRFNNNNRYPIYYDQPGFFQLNLNSVLLASILGYLVYIHSGCFGKNDQYKYKYKRVHVGDGNESERNAINAWKYKHNNFNH